MNLLKKSIQLKNQMELDKISRQLQIQMTNCKIQIKKNLINLTMRVKRMNLPLMVHSPMISMIIAKFISIEKQSLNAPMLLSSTTLTACAKIATMPKGAQRKLVSAHIMTDPFMLRASARIAI